MPALRPRAIASARATRIPVHRTAHQRVRRGALTHTLAGVHLRPHRCCTIHFCVLLLQALHSHITARGSNALVMRDGSRAGGAALWRRSSPRRSGSNTHVGLWGAEADERALWGLVSID